MKVKYKYVLLTTATALLGFGVFLFAKEKGFILNNTKTTETSGAFTTNALEGDSLNYQLTNDNAVKEVEKIAAAYTKDAVFSFKTTTYAYTGDVQTPAEQVSAFYMRAGNSQYYKQADQECLVNDSVALVIDHQVKMMNKLAIGKKASLQDQLSQLKVIEEYMNLDGAETIVEQSQNQKIITITNEKHPSIQQYIIRYSSDTYLVSEIKMLMVIVQDAEEAQNTDDKNENEVDEKDTTVTLHDLGLEQAAYRVVVKYSDYATNLQPTNEQMISHFIQYKNGKIQPAAAFAEYELNY